MTSTTDAPPALGAVRAAVDELRSGLATLAGLDLWPLPDDELAEVLADLVLTQRQVLAQAARVAAEASDRGLPARAAQRDATGWVRATVPSLSASESRAIGRAAEEVFATAADTRPDARPIRWSLVVGAIGHEHARVVSETVAAVAPHVDADVAADAQDFLLAEATRLAPNQLRRVAAYLRHRLDPDADARLAADERAQEAARGLTVYDDACGMVRVEGRLTRQAGAALRAALDAWSAPQPADDGTPDQRTGAQRRHDALERMSEAVLVEPGLLPSTHGSAYRVVVTVPLQTLAEVAEGADAARLAGLAPAALPDGTLLSARRLRELAASADWQAVLVDDHGSPLDVGRTQRLFTPRLRVAVTLRDGGCTYPGCAAPPSWCDVHHLVAWADGGRTDLSNAALLCGRHHRHVTATGEVGRLVAGQVIWEHPTGVDPPQAQLTRATQPSRIRRLVDDLLRECPLPASPGGPDG